ncbi:MAG TPA: type II toxin-antitoxin system HicA family toxin [Ignavibacteria bacterium]|nr:type II toxin-antitoxin system HicA family toxin [Ignavibacteria bacterium]HMQ97554.1 type II toxin-antitoxin system HicA family toxin [Ignavibacteria bacterium]
MKLPRDLNAIQFIKLLRKLDYEETRQSGSHIRLTRKTTESEHHITIPNHNPIKLGTLNNILKDISMHLDINKNDLLRELFD